MHFVSNLEAGGDLTIKGMPDDLYARTPTRRGRCSRVAAYDCEYVVLARELGTPLVTWDGESCRVFGDIALTPAEFVAAQ